VRKMVLSDAELFGYEGRDYVKVGLYHTKCLRCGEIMEECYWYGHYHHTCTKKGKLEPVGLDKWLK
jgi:hypothetical protein